MIPHSLLEGMKQIFPIIMLILCLLLNRMSNEYFSDENEEVIDETTDGEKVLDNEENKENGSKVE